MLQKTHAWITIHDVARDLGYDLDPASAWAIGKETEAAWKCEIGAPPLKDLRVKKRGTGSHCFALYPPHFWPRMERIFRAYRPPHADQGSLF